MANLMMMMKIMMMVLNAKQKVLYLGPHLSHIHFIHSLTGLRLKSVGIVKDKNGCFLSKFKNTSLKKTAKFCK